MWLAAAANSSTTLPTWLVVVVPVLAAVISGAAGMLGALLGGRAASATAERTASLARQDEQARWNREQRKQAYLAFLEERDRLVAAELRAADRGLIYDPADISADRAAHEAALEALFGTALPQVELFGSSQAATAAQDWAWYLVRHRLSWEKLIEEGPSLALVHGTTEERRKHLGPFLKLIRRELGVDV